MKRNFSIFIFSVFTLILIPSCQSSKSSGKGFIGRSLDDLIARDNGYFNARLIMESSEKNLWDQQQDNYEGTLPIFKYGTQEQAASVQPNMDEVIAKTTFVIQLHKKSKWVDDCYFLVGKSDFYKRDYDKSLVAFRYIISEYSNIVEKQPKAKRIEEDADGTLTLLEKLKHQPVSFEAGIWIARSLTEQGKYSDAHTVISVLRSNENFPKWMVGELHAVEADCFMKQHQPAKAIEPLQIAIANTDDKQLQVRYNYILAQLYVQQKEFDKAITAFQEVIDGKPSYDMGFYARLNITKLSMSNYGITGSETKEDLLSLLKDEKYREFYGLIYYTLAEISLSEKKREEAESYLGLSVRNTLDANQKGASYVKLADLYYTDPVYKTAYAYYDSALTNLSKDYENYTEIKLRHDNLKLLVDQLEIIETERKLQYWASLSDRDLEKELEKIIAQEAEKDTTNNDFPGQDVNAQNQVTGGGGDFYFYNPTLRGRGFSEFKKVWGTRPLEDNWRRIEKGTFDNPEDKYAQEENGDKQLDLDNKNLKMEDIIASLPKTPEQITASNAKIAAALYRSGMIYKENFLDAGKAHSSFTENVESYPDNAFEVQSLFQLYQLASGAEKDKYKQEILEKYPDSDYAHLIRDPDYFKHKNDTTENVLDKYYTETYNLLQDKQYFAVRARALAADTLFIPNPMKPKFEMLSALSFANPDSIDVFKNELQKLAIKYPNNEVGDRAQQILDYLRRGSVIDDAGNNTEAVAYIFNKPEEHYFIFIMQGTGKDATTLKNNLSTYNASNFALDNLKISSILIGKDNTLVLVKSFADGDKALAYYHAVKDNAAIFGEMNKEQFSPIIISKSNYVLFYKAKDIDGYSVFFESNYFN
ncbi:MAG: tetratricopeptide repeat protein [Chitinophagales bacterium]